MYGLAPDMPNPPGPHGHRRKSRVRRGEQLQAGHDYADTNAYAGTRKDAGVHHHDPGDRRANNRGNKMNKQAKAVAFIQYFGAAVFAECLSDALNKWVRRNKKFAMLTGRMFRFAGASFDTLNDSNNTIQYFAQKHREKLSKAFDQTMKRVA